jgi:hypothetical protein
MVGPAELKQFTEDDQRASEIANRGGRPWPIDPQRAIVIALGIFFLLELFATITIPDHLDRAVWPTIVLTGVVAGGAYWIARLQERAWFRRTKR